jgi:hypothetical protein
MNPKAKSIKLLCLIAVFSLLSPIDLYAQGWEITVGGNGYDVAYSIEETSDSDFIIVGESNSTNNDKYMVNIVKLSSGGEVISNRKYSPYDELSHGRSIVESNNDDGYIIVGNVSNKDIYLLKVDDYGDTLFSKIYRHDELGLTLNSMSAECIIRSSQGGYLITGFCSQTNGQIAMIDIKISDDGDLVWAKVFHDGSSERNYSYEVIQSPDGSYLHVGEVNGAFTEMLWFKTNLDGDTLWMKRIADLGIGNYATTAHSVALGGDGGFIIAGIGEQSNGFQSVLIKISSDGEVIWYKYYGGSEDDALYSIDVTLAGGFIAAGRTNSFGSGSSDAYLLNLDSSGDTNWVRYYGGAHEDIIYDIKQTSDKGFVAVGSSRSHTSDQNPDLYVIKTDAFGTITTIEEYPATGNGERTLIQTIDFHGRAVNPKKNVPYVEIYNDGLVKKTVILE